jgi:hypothetical protein
VLNEVNQRHLTHVVVAVQLKVGDRQVPRMLSRIRERGGGWYPGSRTTRLPWACTMRRCVLHGHVSLLNDDFLVSTYMSNQKPQDRQSQCLFSEVLLECR